MHSQKKVTAIIICAVIILLLAFNYMLLKPMKSLPSPIYGGDYYYQLGTTNHVKYGGSPLVSSNVNGALPVYFVLYPAITGNLAKILSLDSIIAEYVFSFIIVLCSAAIIFFFARKLFNNAFLAAIAVLLYITAESFPVVKYTEMAYFVMMPLMLFLLCRFVEKPSILNSVLLGFVYGLIGLTHSVAFIASSLLLLLTFLYYALYLGIFKGRFGFKKSKDSNKGDDEIKNKSKITFKEILLAIYPYAIVLVIGVAIAMLWWYKPLFVFHGQTSPHYSEWNNADWSNLSVQFNFIWTVVKDLFFSFGSIIQAIASMLCILGVVGFFLIKNYTNQLKYIRFLFISGLILTFHYLITQNVANTNFIPIYIEYLLLNPIRILVACFGIYFIVLLLKNIKLGERQMKYVEYAFFAIVIVLLLVGQSRAYAMKQGDKWYAAGKNPLPAPLVGLRDYLVSHGAVSDTILTTKEVGFAVNALTGRKLVVARRAHNDPFLDMDPRELDAALMLYGNDSAKRKELLKKYDVKYVYWDTYWVQSEYYVNEQGQVTGWFDPLIMFYSQENEAALSSYNISYFKQYTWVDPALKGSLYKQFDLLFISPLNYQNTTNPWNPDLENYMEEAWSYPQNGQVIARLYRIVNLS